MRDTVRGAYPGGSVTTLLTAAVSTTSWRPFSSVRGRLRRASGGGAPALARVGILGRPCHRHHLHHLDQPGLRRVRIEPARGVGILSILLMLGHTLFATIAVRRGDEQVLQEFHKISLMVWALWMVTLVRAWGPPCGGYSASKS